MTQTSATPQAIYTYHLQAGMGNIDKAIEIAETNMDTRAIDSLLDIRENMESMIADHARKTMIKNK